MGRKAVDLDLVITPQASAIVADSIAIEAAYKQELSFRVASAIEEAYKLELPVIEEAFVNTDVTCIEEVLKVVGAFLNLHRNKQALVHKLAHFLQAQKLEVGCFF